MRILASFLPFFMKEIIEIKNKNERKQKKKKKKKKKERKENRKKKKRKNDTERKTTSGRILKGVGRVVSK